MRRPQMLIFSYHKTGTVLLRNIARAICSRLGLTFGESYGEVRDIDPALDLVVLGHSLLGFELSRPIRGVRVVRDPRDIWVSSYLYHRHCQEPWCLNTDFDDKAW